MTRNVSLRADSGRAGSSSSLSSGAGQLVGRRGLRSRLLGLTPLLCAFLAWPAAAAAEQRVNERDAVRLAIQGNPALKAALIDVRQAEVEIDAAEGAFTPVFSADAGYTHTTSPRATADTYTFSQTDTFAIGAGLNHRFAWGTSLGFRLEGQRNTYSAADLGVNLGSGGANARDTDGANYNLLGRASVVHPLMRGAGREIGEAGIRQARLARTSAERSRDQAASSLLKDVLNGYWELWYQNRSVEIERRARDTAKRQRDEVELRIKAGALAPVELLNYETRLAQLDQSLAAAEANTEQRTVELARLLGSRDSTEDLVVADEQVPSDLSLPMSKQDAYRAAIEESPDIKAQQAQLALARDRASIAGENERSRLDLEAYVQGQSAAYDEVPPLASRFVAEPAISAHVGLVFELPLSGKVRSANRRSAELSVESMEARLESAKQSVRSQVTSAYVQAETARRRVSLAETTVKAAEQQVTAQKTRYEQGSAILLEVQQAEDSLRSAELSVERARVDYVNSLISLEHLTGRLLERFGNLIPKETREAAARRELRAVANIGPL